MENKLEKIGQNSFMDNFVKTDDILNDMCGIIQSSQKAAYQAVNTLLVQNWLIGYRIAEEELGGDERSEYGLEVIKKISKELTQRYGKGYDRSNLYHCLKFYKTFPEIVDTVCRQSSILLRGHIIEHYYKSKTLKLVTGIERSSRTDLECPYFAEKYFFAVLLPYAQNSERRDCRK